MSARADYVPRVQLHTAGHPDGGHAVPAAEAVGEDEAAVDQKQGEVVPRVLCPCHVQDQPLSLGGLQLQRYVGVEPGGVNIAR